MPLTPLCIAKGVNLGVSLHQLQSLPDTKVMVHLKFRVRRHEIRPDF